jgi:hypothetical protein
MKRMSHNQRQRVERALRAAYRDWQAPLLSPPAPKRGLSQLPTPRRSTMANPPSIPAARVETLPTPKRDRQLYESDGTGAYELTFAGKVLAHYRQQAAENLGDVPPPRKIIRFDRETWAHLIAVAEPEARTYFLRQAAAGVIKVAR